MIRYLCISVLVVVLGGLLCGADPVNAKKPAGNPGGKPSGPEYVAVELLPAEAGTHTHGKALNDLDSGCVDVVGNCGPGSGWSPCLWTVTVDSKGIEGVEPTLLPRIENDRSARASALNNSNPPVIVGFEDLGFDYDSPPGGSYIKNHAAVWRFAQNSWHVTLLPPPDELPKNDRTDYLAVAVDDQGRVSGTYEHYSETNERIHSPLFWECREGENCLDMNDWVVTVLPLPDGNEGGCSAGPMNRSATRILGSCKEGIAPNGQPSWVPVLWTWDGAAWATPDRLPCDPTIGACGGGAINEQGDVAGSITYWGDESWMDPHSPGPDVVAVVWLFDETQGYTYPLELGGLRGNYSAASGIRDRTTPADTLPIVVGFAEPSKRSNLIRGEVDAVRWVDGAAENLNDLIQQRPEWWLRFAYGINQSGWITGEGILDGNRYNHGYVLIPVP